MSSGIGGGISGGVSAGRGGGRGGGGTHRKNSKKFGKNLNKLTKAPAAPPVPVISSGGGGGTNRSFRGSSSSRNGLLLLSTKSKSSGVGGGGLLASSGSPKTAHDALLLSAGAGGQEGGEAGKKTAAPAWGMGEKKQREPAPSLESRSELSMGGNKKPDLVLSRRNIPAQQQRPFVGRSAVNEMVERVEKVDLNRGNIPAQRQRPFVGRPAVDERVERVERIDLHRGNTPAQQQRPFVVRSSVDETVEKVEKIDLSRAESHKKVALDGGVSKYEKFTDKISVNVAHPKEIDTEPKEKPDLEAKQAQPKQQKVEKVKDDQVEYMSKLAKERAEKLRLEEEERMAAQKERAAMRLRELEEKRLEEKKKQLQMKSQARKELSRPSTQVILEPLGKSKKDALDSSSPKPTSNPSNAEKKNGGRTLYDPDRPFSSLVGGKVTKSIAPGAKKEDRPRGNTKKSPVHGPTPAPHGKHPLGQSSTDNKKEEPQPVHMVQLSNLGDLDRGGRGEGQSGPRMLFDPTSGSMVAVKSREEPKSTKKTKMKGPQKVAAKRPEDVSKVITRRPVDTGAVASESSSDVKLLRGKPGKGSRKDEATTSQRNKKPLDNRGRQTPRKRIPRTCGVLYKMDKSGNYIHVDGCDPDNGYGAHRVPGGRVKNPDAHAKLLKQQEEDKAETQPSTDAPLATEGFSFRNDPGFLQHQTDDFEAQQQKILEDAWASLVENEELKDEESDEEVEVEDEVPASKSGDDEYAAALAINPSMIGLNFDTNDNLDSVLLPPSIKAKEEPIDLVKFALEAASSAGPAPPANPFSPLGVSGAGLWGAGTPGASGTAYGDLGALTGWDATPFAETGTATAAGSAGLNGSNSQASKLHLWGSSAFDDNVFGSFGNNSDTPKGSD